MILIIVEETEASSPRAAAKATRYVCVCEQYTMYSAPIRFRALSGNLSLLFLPIEGRALPWEEGEIELGTEGHVSLSEWVLEGKRVERRAISDKRTTKPPPSLCPSPSRIRACCIAEII